MNKPKSDTTTRPQGMPEDTPDYMAPAWVGCMQLAMRKCGTPSSLQPGYRATPEWGPDKNGYSKEYVGAFIDWANQHVWGH